MLGRQGSLRSAAAELGVTPGAVSQQVIKAEAQLGCRLFERGPSGMELTAKGQQVADQFGLGFRMLAEGVALASDRRSDVITIAVPPIFAGRWLVWPLNRFNKAYPEIKVRVNAAVDLVDLRTGDADAAIRIGRGNWTGAVADKLFTERVFPICAPDLAEKIKTPEDLLRVPVIRDINSIVGWNV